jgi:hypothetical protein
MRARIRLWGRVCVHLPVDHRRLSRPASQAVSHTEPTATRLCRTSDENRIQLCPRLFLSASHNRRIDDNSQRTVTGDFSTGWIHSGECFWWARLSFAFWKNRIRSAQRVRWPGLQQRVVEPIECVWRTKLQQWNLQSLECVWRQRLQQWVDQQVECFWRTGLQQSIWTVVLDKTQCLWRFEYPVALIYSVALITVHTVRISAATGRWLGNPPDRAGQRCSAFHGVAIDIIDEIRSNDCLEKFPLSKRPQ